MIILSRLTSVAVFGLVLYTIRDASLITTNTLGFLANLTLLCILGSHIFFNLKEAAEHGVNVGTNWSSYSHSAIHFNEPGSVHAQ